jgi:hypothetical protein
MSPAEKLRTLQLLERTKRLRSIDKRRVRRIFGQVSPSELAGIDQGLELFLGLGAAS